MVSQRGSLLSIHLVALLFGATGILGALIQASPLIITFGRAAFALITLYLISYIRRETFFPYLSGTTFFQLILTSLALCIHWVSFFIAVKGGGVAIATLGFASFPAFIVFIEWLILREKIGRIEIIMVMLVTLGLILIAPTFSFEDQGTIALLWGILSGLTFAILAVMNRFIRLKPIQVAAVQNLLVALYLAPFIGSSIVQISLKNWLWIAVLGVLCTGIAHSLFVMGLQQIKARTAGLIVALEPIYAIFFAWVLFQQIPTLWMLVGGTMILLSAIYASLS